MLGLAILVVSSLLAMPLAAELAVAADARAAGDDAPDGVVLAAGVALAVLYPLAGLLALGRAVMAAALFLLAAALGLVVGRTGGWDGLAIYGLLALLLAAASVVCARRQRTRLNVEERPVSARTS